MPRLYPDDWDLNDPYGYVDPRAAANWDPTPTFKLPQIPLTQIGRKPMSRETRVRQLRNEFDRILGEITRLENRPEEPTDWVNGIVPPIIYVRRTYAHGSAEYYDYAFIKAGDGYWYSTAAIGPKKKTWDQILDWIEQGTGELPEIHLVTDVKVIGRVVEENNE